MKLGKFKSSSKAPIDPNFEEDGEEEQEEKKGGSNSPEKLEVEEMEEEDEIISDVVLSEIEEERTVENEQEKIKEEGDDNNAASLLSPPQNVLVHPSLTPPKYLQQNLPPHQTPIVENKEKEITFSSNQIQEEEGSISSSVVKMVEGEAPPLSPKETGLIEDMGDYSEEEEEEDERLEDKSNDFGDEKDDKHLRMKHEVSEIMDLAIMEEENPVNKRMDSWVDATPLKEEREEMRKEQQPQEDVIPSSVSNEKEDEKKQLMEEFNEMLKIKNQRNHQLEQKLREEEIQSRIQAEKVMWERSQEEWIKNQMLDMRSEVEREFESRRDFRYQTLNQRFLQLEGKYETEVRSHEKESLQFQSEVLKN